MTEPDGFPGYEPKPGLPANRPPRAAVAGHLVGRADGVQLRVEGQVHERASQTVLTFRMLDPATDRPVEVEVRGHLLSGTVRDGDWVEVADRRNAGRLEVSKLTNLTTGSEVAAPLPLIRRTAKVLGALFILLFLVVLTVILVTAFQMLAGSSDFP